MQINQKGNKKYIKFSITFPNIHSFKIFTEQSSVSEDFALKELINVH